MDRIRWADHTWREVRDLGEGWCAILPVGAVEAHGPHLAVRADGIIAEAMAEAGAALLRERRVEALVLPTLDYTSASFAAGFAGTISVDPDSVTRLIASIARSVVGQGGSALVLANAHLDPTHLGSLHAAVREAEATGARIVFPDVTRKPWALRLTDEFRSGACHAGQYETSIVMAVVPEAVRDDIRAALPSFMRSLSDAIREGIETFEQAGGGDAYFGAPAQATADEGRETIAELGAILAEAVEQALSFPPEAADPAARETTMGAEARDGVDLSGRGAVVTGAGRGIGAAIAQELAAAGASVVVSARSAEEIEATAADIRSAGGSAWAATCDVSHESSVAALMKQAEHHLGHVDILVNNAGVAHSSPIHRETVEGWERLMSVNALGAFLCIRAVLPAMVERGWGRIVNVASVAGLEGARYIAAYAASKHALVGLTRSAAAEASGTGVTVNAVCPGYVDTPMTGATIENVMERTGMGEDEAVRAVLDASGQQRLVTPEEVAAGVLDLCATAAGHRTGEAIVIDGR